jgi:hypothetical protein
LTPFKGSVLPAESLITGRNETTVGAEESLAKADEFARMAAQSQRIVADFIA